MLDHWHNVHGYSLLQCVDNRPGHDHAQDGTLSLRESVELSSSVPYAEDKHILYPEDVDLLRARLAGKVTGDVLDVAYVCLTEVNSECNSTGSSVSCEWEERCKSESDESDENKE